MRYSKSRNTPGLKSGQEWRPTSAPTPFREHVEGGTSFPAIRNIDERALRHHDSAANARRIAQPATDGNVSDGNVSADELDRYIAELSGPSPDQQRISELTGQVDSLRAEEFRRGELQAFNDMAADLQQQLPSFVPPDYAEMRLKALAHDQTIALAWDLRNTDKAAAQFELARVTREFLQLKQDPAADPKRLQELSQYGARLEIAISAKAILRKVRLDVINAAAKLPKPLDDEANAVRADIAHLMKEGGSGRERPPEPQVQLGGLDTQEYRRHVRETYGFDPNV
jgi:hypothetical protein